MKQKSFISQREIAGEILNKIAVYNCKAVRRIFSDQEIALLNRTLEDPMTLYSAYQAEYLVQTFTPVEDTQMATVCADATASIHTKLSRTLTSESMHKRLLSSAEQAAGYEED